MDLRKRILVVEDEEDIALSLKYNFEKDGRFLVDTARDGEGALEQAARTRFDLVILDLNLPGMDGLTVCKALRSQSLSTDVPIIMVTARVEETDKIVGLEVGADDYITKPFSRKELMARARALLRRLERPAGGAGIYSDRLLYLDPQGRVVKVKGRELSLTRKEFDLLAVLVKSRGRVLSREQILQRIWGYHYFGETRTIDVHVRRLRRKLGKPAQDLIETVIGIGYRFHASE